MNQDSVIEIAPETVETIERDDIKIELSPNGEYLVAHSRRDRSIVGWNVEDIDEGSLKQDRINTEDTDEGSLKQDRINTAEDTDEGPLKQDRINTAKLFDSNGNKSVIQICVSDDKKLVYIYKYADL